VLERPDLPLSPSAEEERLDPTSTPETLAAPAPSPPEDTAPSPPPEGHAGEEMVPDARAALTPAQVVERKVITLLKGGSLPLRCTVAGFAGGHARRPPASAA
jgi:hypothetical protein